jgi:hypothetical protein
VIERLDDVVGIAADRAAIARATERCLAIRDMFTNEHNAVRIREFVEPLLARRITHAEAGRGREIIT